MTQKEKICMETNMFDNNTDSEKDAFLKEILQRPSMTDLEYGVLKALMEFD